MVIVDIDHPDVEEFVSWKVQEEQKVAALVTGSKLNKHHADALMSACQSSDVPEEEQPHSPHDPD